MKNGARFFAIGTVFLLSVFFSVGGDQTMAPETLDAKIKITSLSGANPVLNREPVVFPQINSQASPRKILTEKNTPSRIAPPEIQASAALVAEMFGDQTLLELGAEKRWPIASITKLMTAILSAEEIGFQKQVTLTAEDILSEGSAGNFKEGEIFTVGDLVEAMLVVSSNDAAEAVARFFGYRAFIDLMQEKARDIGMNDTTFMDPTGLTSLNQSTLRDLTILVHYIATRHPEFFELSRQKTTRLKELSGGVERIIKNINALSEREDFLGGKTGYTDEAGGNLISIFGYQNNQLIIIVLGTANRFAETEKLYEWARVVLE